MSKLLNISSIDSRYYTDNEIIRNYFGEFSIIRYKLLVMIEYLVSLSKIELFDLKDEEITYLKNIYKNIKVEECEKWKNYENIEDYNNYIINEINKNPSLEDKGISIFVNFSLVKEDIYGIVNIIILKNVINKIILMNLSELLNGQK